MDGPLALPVGPVAPALYPLAIMPGVVNALVRVTRVGWSLSGTTGAYQIRLVTLSALDDAASFTPAQRRAVAIPSLTSAHRGVGVVATVAPGTPILATWIAAGLTQNAEGAEQEAVLENPIELVDRRGLALEISTFIGGDATIEAYFDWEEFQ
jgi:hypothetical protein